MTVPWLREQAGGAVLSLHVQPGAKKTGIAGEHGGALKIRLAAPPVDGKANECLLRFLAEALRLPKSSVTLVSGETCREKRVGVAGLDAAEVESRLSAT